MLFNTLVLLSAIASGLCANSPPSGSITVGPGGKYTTLSEALTDTSSNVYFVYGTSIKERVVITRSNVTIYGQTSDESTYSQNKATIYNNIPASTAGSNEASATVSIHASAKDVKIYNLNIANTYGRVSLKVSFCLGLHLLHFNDNLLSGLTSHCSGNQ
jgi:pectinesterase